MGNECNNKRQVRLDGGEKDKNDDTEFVKILLALHDKHLGVIKSVFSSHSLFQKALKDAFVEIVNKKVGQFPTAELMSTFCDCVLKSGGETLSELTDKDLFAEIYRNQLAKRLLNQRRRKDDDRQT